MRRETMKSIDDFINYEEEYKKYLQKSRKNGNSLIAKCPFHQDDKPSFSVDLINDNPDHLRSYFKTADSGCEVVDDKKRKNILSASKPRWITRIH